MRQVAQPDFCVVCTEALWLRLLARVNLIDQVTVHSTCSSEIKSKEHDAQTTIELSLVPLAHLRSASGASYVSRKGTKEAYQIRWFNRNAEIEAWRNSSRVEVQCGTETTFEVEVKFDSSEIRKDEKGYTVDRKQVWINH
jgi:hypothetical protein